MKTTKRYQLAFSLIEIMFALVIGTFILAGVITIFLNSKQTYRMQEALSRLQENGRFAMDFIANDIRMAGFIGCNNSASLTTTCTAAGVPSGCKMPNTLEYSPASYLYKFDTAIEGFNTAKGSTTWTPALSSVQISDRFPSALYGSDIITIRRASDLSFTVTAHAGGTADLTLDTFASIANLQTAGFLKPDGSSNCTVAVVSDCSKAAVFQVSAINIGTRVLSHGIGGSCASPKNQSNDLGASFLGAQVYPINAISYFVRTGSSNQPSLYRRIGSNAPEELIEGIDDMQILYGVDTDAAGTAGVGSANYYVEMPANMAQVVSVRITLTARTLDDKLVSIEDATFLDRRLRHTFTSTIAVRNRIK